MCLKKSFFLNCFEVADTMSLSPEYFSACSWKKGHFLTLPHTTTKFRKLAMMKYYYLIHRCYPHFTSCPTNVLL